MCHWNLRPVVGRIVGRTHSRSKSMPLLCCAINGNSLIRLQWIWDCLSSMALDDATDFVGIVVFLARDTRHIFKSRTDWHMESTSWLSQWIVRKCRLWVQFFYNISALKSKFKKSDIIWHIMSLAYGYIYIFREMQKHFSNRTRRIFKKIFPDKSGTFLFGFLRFFWKFVLGVVSCVEHEYCIIFLIWDICTKIYQLLPRKCQLFQLNVKHVLGHFEIVKLCFMGFWDRGNQIWHLFCQIRNSYQDYHNFYYESDNVYFSKMWFMAQCS